MRPIYITGLDLGQQNDYSALTVTERTMWGEKPRYSVRHLVRWPLQTPYTTIVEDVVKIFSRPPLTGTILCVDATGVGKAVVDLLRASRPEARISPIVITSGHYAARVESQWSVPKKDLVAVLQVLLSSRRFQIASGLPHARTLAKELAAFRVKVKASTGHESFEHWRSRDHDDLVLSVAMALWYGERGSLTQPLRIIVPGKSKERAKKLRIVVATGPELAETVIEDLRTLLVCVHDPASNEGEDWFTNPPKHGIDKKVFLGSLHLPFLRMEPQDYQDTWLDTIPPWNRTPPELMMSREHGKLLWKFLLQKRPEPWEILVFWDNGDGRALSLAYGICAALGLPRSRTIYCVGNPDLDLSQDPPSKFIVEQTKLCRNMIVG